MLHMICFPSALPLSDSHNLVDDDNVALIPSELSCLVVVDLPCTASPSSIVHQTTDCADIKLGVFLVFHLWSFDRFKCLRLEEFSGAGFFGHV